MFENTNKQTNTNMFENTNKQRNTNMYEIQTNKHHVLNTNKETPKMFENTNKQKLTLFQPINMLKQTNIISIFCPPEQ